MDRHYSSDVAVSGARFSHPDHARSSGAFPMRRQHLAPVLLALVAILVPNALGLPALAEEPKPAVRVPPGVVYRPDLTFCTFDAKTCLRLDLAYPANGPGPYPGVVCIHGGGWLYGSAKKHVPLCLELARQGYVAASITYRFAPSHPFPAPVQDVKCAVRWLRAHAADYKLDKDRVGAVGFSAGGHLACLLGSTSPKDDLEGDGGYAEQSSRVQAVVSWYGLTDLARLHECCLQGKLPAFETTLMKGVLEGFLGGPPALVGERYAKASPVTYAAKTTAPTLLIHGTADRKVPFEQSTRYERRLKALGVPVRLLALEGAPHDFTGEPQAKARQATCAFLDEYLKKK